MALHLLQSNWSKREEMIPAEIAGRVCRGYFGSAGDIVTADRRIGTRCFYFSDGDRRRVSQSNAMRERPASKSGLLRVSGAVIIVTSDFSSAIYDYHCAENFVQAHQ